MKKILLAFFSAILLWSCEETDLLDETGRLEITDFNLPELPTGYNYQGWLLIGGTYVSVGTFNIDSINNNRARFSNIETSDLALAEAFAITVEDASSPAPSNYVLLVGDFNGGSADLFVNATSHSGVTTLANKISASYTIQNATVTPDLPGTFTENGIWFFKGEDTQAETTLSLLYGELRYQAWVQTTTDAGARRYLNMGVIGADTGRDSRNAYTSQTTSAIPQFSGEDFLVQPEGETFPVDFFPKNVGGSKVFLTPIFSGFINEAETPFPIQLLISEIPTDITNDINITYPMQINTNFGAKVTKL